MSVYPPLNPVDVSRHPLVCRLAEIRDRLGLDDDDMVVFGSGPLLAHGLRRRIRDLDVVARGATWERVAVYGERAVGTISGEPMVHFWGGRIQFSRRWISAGWDTDRLIDRAEVLHGLRFARLSDVLAYKHELRRPKDLADLHALSWLPPAGAAGSAECPG